MLFKLYIFISSSDITITLPLLHWSLGKYKAIKWFHIYFPHKPSDSRGKSPSIFSTANKKHSNQGTYSC